MLEMNRKSWAMIGLMAAIAAFGVALIAQYVFGMRPCPLCIWQRYPYGVGIAFGAVGLALGAAGGAGRVSLALAASAFVVGAGLGVFHSGVEFGWWEGLASCGGAPIGGGPLSAEALLEELRTAPTVGCADRVPFFIGLTMANWNILASLAMAGCFALATFEPVKPRRPAAA